MYNQIIEYSDLLERRFLAQKILDNILNSPQNTSTRYAIFGAWGSGKTTLCNYIIKLAEKRGHISIIIDVSQYNTFESLQDKLVTSIKNNAYLKKYFISSLRIKIKNFIQRMNWRKLFSSSEINLPFGTGAIKIPLITVINAWNNLSPKEISNLVTGLEQDNKRLIIILENLDRADHNTIPSLLMSISEFMNINGLAYIILCDREIVAKILNNYNNSYGTGHKFLEKILDYYETLPSLSNQNKKMFLQKKMQEFSNNRLKIKNNLIEEISYLLPDNPRKLTSLARNIYLKSKILIDNLTDDSDRHMRSLIYLSIVKEISPQFLKVLSKQIRWEEIFPPNSPDHERFIENQLWPNDDQIDEFDTPFIRKMQELLKDINDINEEEKPQLLNIIKQWLGSREPYDPEYIFICDILENRYNCIIDHDIHNIIKRSLKNKKLNKLDKQIKKITEERNTDYQEIIKSTLKNIIYSIQSIQHQSLSMITLEEYASAMSKIKDLLDLFSSIWKQQEHQTFLVGFEIFLDYLISSDTSYYQTKYDKKIRKYEEEIFKECLTKKQFDSSEMISILSKKIQSKTTRHRDEFLESCWLLIGYIPQNILIELFKKKDGILSFTKEISPKMRKLRKDHNQIILFDNMFQEKIILLIENSNNDQIVYNNLYYYLSFISRHSSSLSFMEISGFIGKIWEAIIAKELNHKKHDEILNIRNNLLERKIKKTALPVPKWIPHKDSVAKT